MTIRAVKRCGCGIDEVARMMKITVKELKNYVEEHRIVDGLQSVRLELEQLEKAPSHLTLRKKLAEFQSSDDLYELIRLLDDGLMYRYSSVVTRYAYRHFGTFQMAVFLYDEFVREGKTLQAKRELDLLLKTTDLNTVTPKQIETAYFLMVRILLEIKRFDEAKQWMQKVEQYNETEMFDKWGYFYIQTGEWEKAEYYLSEGIGENKKSDMCFLFLADLYAAKGEHDKALHTINEALSMYPQLPALYMEKVRKLKDLQCYEELLEAVNDLEQILITKEYHSYFTQLKAEAYFYLKNASKLQVLVEQEESLKNTPYAKLMNDGQAVKLPIKPIIQKDNYCVPASLSMILSLFNQPKTQDEIAEHIYSQLGSKLSTAVEYTESLGYSCRFFTGTIETYKQLLHNGTPILVSVEFEHASHVQVVYGYNDQLQAFYVQDPNFLNPQLVEYSEFERAYVNSGYLSIAICKEEAGLAFLSERDHYFFKELYRITELVEQDEERYIQQLIALLESHGDIPFSPLFGIKHIFREDSRQVTFEWLHKLLTTYPNNDYIRLHTAYAFFRTGEKQKAGELLQQVKEKRTSSFYYYLKGRLHFEDDQYTQAITYFQRSLQLDIEQHLVLSYLALAYFYKDDVDYAFELSHTSLSFYDEEPFSKVNHALILNDLGKTQEARTIFDELLRHDRTDAFLWYERAKCDQRLEKGQKAYRGFMVAKHLQPDMLYPYISLADWYQHEKDDSLKAETILCEGIKQVESNETLSRLLGDLYIENKEYEKAIQLFANADTPMLQNGLAYAYLQAGRLSGALKLYEQALIAEEYDQDAYLDAGNALVHFCKENGLQEGIEVGISLIEKGLAGLETDLDQALESYVGFMNDFDQLERGVTFLKQEWKMNPKEILYGCYAGVLLEEEKRYDEAIALYEETLRVEPNGFSYYRLGEVYKEMDLVGKAKEAYELSVYYDRRNSGAYENLILIARMEEDEAAERDYLYTVLQFDPLDVNMERLSHLCKTESDYAELINYLETVDTPSLQGWVMDSLAYVYGAKGDKDQEEKCLLKALEMSPNQQAVQHHYANWCIQQGNLKEAKLVMLTLIKENVEEELFYATWLECFPSRKELLTLSTHLKKLNVPKEEKAFIYMNTAVALQAVVEEFNDIEEESAFLKRTIKKFKEKATMIALFGMIIELHETAIKLDRTNVQAVHALASFYEERQMEDEAIALLERKLKETEDLSIGHHLMHIIINLDHDDESIKKGLFFLEFLLDIEPYNFDFLLYQAILLGEQGSEVEAEEKFKQLLKQQKYDPNVYAGLGKLYNRIERYDEAIGIFNEGIENGQTNTLLYVELGIAYHLTGQTQVAAELMAKRLEEEDDLFIRYNLACYLASIGDIKQAEQELHLVLEQDESGQFYEMAKGDEDLRLLRVK